MIKFFSNVIWAVRHTIAKRKFERDMRESLKRMDTHFDELERLVKKWGAKDE